VSAHSSVSSGLRFLPARFDQPVQMMNRPIDHDAFAIHCIPSYVLAVIRSWRNAASRKVWQGEQPNRFRGLDFDAAIDLLLALNIAKALQT
jgi:hypothetical protein